MPPVQFGDFSKSVTDVFDKNGFTADKKIKQTFKTPAVFGGAITVSQEIKGFDDHSKGFGGKISAKWKHACGFSIDKFDNDVSKGTVLETSFNKFAVPGLSVAVNMSRSYKDGKSKFPVELKYENEFFASSVATEAPGFSGVTANVVLAAEGITVGSSLKFNGVAAPTDYPISLSYSGKDYVAAIEATNELKTFTLLGSYKASSQLKFAGKFMIPDKEKQNVALAAVYNLSDEFDTKLAGMYSHDQKKEKTIEFAATAKPVNQVETGFALAFPLSDPSNYKYGLTFTLG